MLAQLPVTTQPATTDQPPVDLSVQGSRSYLNDMNALHEKALYWLGIAEGQGSAQAAGAWIRELKGIIEASHKMYATQKQLEREAAKDGTLDAGNPEKSPEWINLRTKMLTALLPYPEARAGLSAAMRAQGQTILEEKVSPAVQRMIDAAMEWNGPYGDGRDDPKPAPTESAPTPVKSTIVDNKPTRYWHKFLAETMLGSFHWHPGMIWDGSQPACPEPVDDGIYWTPINPGGFVEVPGPGLQATRRRLLPTTTFASCPRSGKAKTTFPAKSCPRMEKRDPPGPVGRDSCAPRS
jgi:hypothetical protein